MVISIPLSLENLVISIILRHCIYIIPLLLLTFFIYLLYPLMLFW